MAASRTGICGILKRGNLLELSRAMGGRLVILLPMAFCIFLLLDSQDRNVRLFALIALIILEQVREWLLISSIKELGKRGDNKK
jgi:hypothetical protein